MSLTLRQPRFQAVCVVALVLPLFLVLAPELGAAEPLIASAITVAACQLVTSVIVASRKASTLSANAARLQEESTDG